jgi:hypothetical protein
MLHFGVIASRYMLWRKFIASRSCCSRNKEAVIATHSYRSGNILAVIASKVIALKARQKLDNRQIHRVLAMIL